MPFPASPECKFYFVVALPIWHLCLNYHSHTALMLQKLLAHKAPSVPMFLLPDWSTVRIFCFAEKTSQDRLTVHGHISALILTFTIKIANQHDVQ